MSSKSFAAQNAQTLLSDIGALMTLRKSYEIIMQGLNIVNINVKKAL